MRWQGLVGALVGLVVLWLALYGLLALSRLAGLDRRPPQDAWVLDGIEDDDLAG
jgi:hypothetical protein